MSSLLELPACDLGEVVLGDLVLAAPVIARKHLATTHKDQTGHVLATTFVDPIHDKGPERKEVDRGARLCLWGGGVYLDL